MNEENDFQQKQDELISDTPQHVQAQPFDEEITNPVLGFAGAVIGSLPGCALWLILGRVGFIAGIAGFAIMTGAMFLYRKFGGGLERGGMIICAIVTVIMIFCTNCADYGISVYKLFTDAGYVISAGEIVMMLPSIIADPEIIGGFILNLLVGYGLTALSCRRLFT